MEIFNPLDHRWIDYRAAATYCWVAPLQNWLSVLTAKNFSTAHYVMLMSLPVFVVSFRVIIWLQGLRSNLVLVRVYMRREFNIFSRSNADSFYRLNGSKKRLAECEHWWEGITRRTEWIKTTINNLNNKRLSGLQLKFLSSNKSKKKIILTEQHYLLWFI